MNYVRVCNTCSISTRTLPQPLIADARPIAVQTSTGGIDVVRSYDHFALSSVFSGASCVLLKAASWCAGSLFICTFNCIRIWSKCTYRSCSGRASVDRRREEIVRKASARRDPGDVIFIDIQLYIYNGCHFALR